MAGTNDFSTSCQAGGRRGGRMLAQGLAVAVLGVLAACGGDGAVAPPDDPLQPYREQVVDWQPCDPEVMGGDSIAYQTFKDRLTCATIRVPLDYSNTSRGDAVVAVTRVAAGEPSQRQGAILINPGGPGGDGLTMSLMLASLWSGADASTTAGQLLPTIVQRYDMIGFSPRGVGASSRLYCATNGALQPERHSSDRSEANIAAMLFNAHALADACLRNPLAKYVNTDNTVRDMDLIRELLGDAKFNYYGISYGTWLGAWYASLFPERVGRMVLDSSMDVTGPIDVNLVWQPMSMQRVLDSFIPKYASAYPGLYNLGTDPAAIAAVFRGLPEPMRVAFDRVLSLHSVLNLTRRVERGVQLIAAAKGMHWLIEEDSARAQDPNALNDALMEYTFSDDFGQDIEIRGLAQAMVEPYFEALEPAPGPISLRNSDSVFHSVVCNDTPVSNTDTQYWVGLGNEMAARYPYSGGSVTRHLCLDWGGPSVVKPPLSQAARAGQILMLQSEFDALTATEGALRSFEQLPQAHLVTVTNHYTHGLVGESIPCVDEMIGRYFLDGVVAGRSSVCEGPPLPEPTSDKANRMAKMSAPKDAAELAREALRAKLDEIAASGARF